MDTVKVDDRGRVKLPDAKPGDVYHIEAAEELPQAEAYTLRRVKKPKPDPDGRQSPPADGI